jgi:Tfp pilus assembly protein PilV
MKHTRNHTRRAGESGFTLIEVLIAATTFLVGFTLIIALLNQTVTKLSVHELETARELATDEMFRAQALHDTTSTSTVLKRDDLSYRVSRVTTVDLPFVAINVTVAREKNGKELVSLYNAFILSPQ